VARFCNDVRRLEDAVHALDDSDMTPDDLAQYRKVSAPAVVQEERDAPDAVRADLNVVAHADLSSLPTGKVASLSPAVRNATTRLARYLSVQCKITWPSDG
jgi:hypothetical protein